MKLIELGSVVSETKLGVPKANKFTDGAKYVGITFSFKKTSTSTKTVVNNNDLCSTESSVFALEGGQIKCQ